MTVGRSLAAVLVAVEAHVIEVEAHVADGLVGMTVTGLADAAVTESRDRVRSAAQNSGYSWPQKRVTVGLSPAWLPKSGSGMDLAIAVAVLVADQPELPVEIQQAAAETMWFGELGLDGRVKPVRGVLLAAMAARERGCRRIVVAPAAVAEASLVEGLEVLAAGSLSAALRTLGWSGGSEPDLESGLPEVVAVPATPAADFADVRGQAVAKFALEVAAAGGHHLALLGSPGVGKTLLASRLPGILPPLDEASALQVTAIASLVGSAPSSGLVTTPPFAAPHHTSSYPALIGGGTGVPVIGMVTLAHRGVLFLDEAPEFASNVLDALRQPLESGEVVLGRRTFQLRLPARFQLVLAANPCPCGYALDPDLSCRCTPSERRRYLGRISGPLMDRVDIRVVVDPPSAVELAADGPPGERSSAIRERVLAAREVASRRLADTPWRCNADVPGPRLREFFPLTGGAAARMNQLVAGHRSARGVDQIAKLAWTISDLRAQSSPTARDVEAAIDLRQAGGRWLN